MSLHVQQGTENTVLLPALNLRHGSSSIGVVELHREFLDRHSNWTFKEIGCPDNQFLKSGFKPKSINLVKLLKLLPFSTKSIILFEIFSEHL